MPLTIFFDHRVTDGLLPARFLERVKLLLESPGMLAS